MHQNATLNGNEMGEVLVKDPYVAIANSPYSAVRIVNDISWRDSRYVTSWWKQWNANFYEVYISMVGSSRNDVLAEMEISVQD